MSVHVPVLAPEALEFLALRAGQTGVDGTLGAAGHTQLMAAAVGPTGLVLALDRDPAAVAAAEPAVAGLPVELINESYERLPEVLAERGIRGVDAVLLDLGLSSDQLADAERGFSFHADGPLDLRFNRDQGEPAWKLLQYTAERQLADLIYQYGEERKSRRIARRIVETRRTAPIRTSAQLADLIQGCVPVSRNHRIHPATRTFQALRIAVNDELGALERLLQRLPDCLVPGGRAVVISFHSLEDRIVKLAFRDAPGWRRVTKKPIRPGDVEVRNNPRSRSARLRVAVREDE